MITGEYISRGQGKGTINEKKERQNESRKDFNKRMEEKKLEAVSSIYIHVISFVRYII